MAGSIQGVFNAEPTFAYSEMQNPCWEYPDSTQVSSPDVIKQTMVDAFFKNTVHPEIALITEVFFSTYPRRSLLDNPSPEREAKIRQMQANLNIKQITKTEADYPARDLVDKKITSLLNESFERRQAEPDEKKKFMIQIEYDLEIAFLGYERGRLVGDTPWKGLSNIKEAQDKFIYPEEAYEKELAIRSSSAALRRDGVGCWS